RLHADRVGPGPGRPPRRGDDRVRRRRPHLPGALGAGPEDHPGLQLRAGDGARLPAGRHPQHDGRRLGAPGVPRPGQDERDEGVRAMSTTTTLVTGGDRTRRRSARRVEPIYYLFLLPSLLLFTLAITIPGVIG